MFKRIFLFIIVNILVLITISITLSVLGVRGYLNAYGIDYTSLLIYAAVVGFAGAFISLLFSKFFAKLMMGVRIIEPAKANYEENILYNMVSELSKAAGLPAVPEVGIYDSQEVNAFATGPSKSNSLVAVSTGLLHRLDSQAVKGVIGHEIAHIANGDMVTMTLLQGVVNTFVIFLSRIAAWAASMALSKRDSDESSQPSPLIHFICVIAFDIIFSILGSIVVAYFSRKREFRADSGGAKYAGRENMIHALQSLKNTIELIDTTHKSIATLKISNTSKVSVFSTHPALDERIELLKKGK
ncbi:protease HtpX [Candidatus Dependentiae bacterium]|nr:protease HtpX [Candidatus Dependentiae bacterium]